MDIGLARQRFEEAEVARLATVSADGTPHLVPMVFAMIDSVIYSAVDGKPKKSNKLKRLANIAVNNKVCLIADEYQADWKALWWARADGVARIIEVADPEWQPAVDALIAKYRQYQDEPELRPRGQVIAVDVRSWHGWQAR